MIVYHGSKVIVEHPDVLHSRMKVDFGKGFYVTPLKEQAINLCNRFLKTDNSAFISAYKLNDTVFTSKEINFLRFETYSEKLLQFIIDCRTGTDNSNYDIIMGGVANDKVFDTIELYFQNLISASAALGRLIYEKPNMQICIRSQQIIDDYLTFIGSEQL